MFQSPHSRSSPMVEFSKAIRTLLPGLPSARSASEPKTSRNFGTDSSMVRPLNLPMKPATMSVPKK